MSNFRNLVIYRFGQATAMDLLFRLTAALEDYPVREPGPMESFTNGFASTPGTGELTTWIGSAVYLVYAANVRMLSSAQVNEEVAKVIKRIWEEEGRKVGGRERKRIKEDVINTLLPHAPIRRTRNLVCIDTSNRWLVVDTSSRNVADAAVSRIREALGSFPALPLAPEESPRLVLTAMLGGASYPNWHLGTECEMRDPATSTGAVAKYRNQDLDAEEVQENLRNGKVAVNVGVVISERYSLVIREDLQVRKLKFMDDAEVFDAEDQQQILALQCLELDQLTKEIFDLFDCPQPE